MEWIVGIITVILAIRFWRISLPLAALVRRWLAALQVQTLFIEPGSPWENGYVESFNGKLRDALLNRATFSTLTEAKSLIERWRREDNTVRPHRALGYRPPAPEVISPAPLSGPMMMSQLSHQNWPNPGGQVNGVRCPPYAHDRPDPGQQ